MKLLSKSKAQVESQNRKKVEIEEGLKLENIVQTLRDQKSKEEKGLQQFREGSLAEIRREIDDEVKKRDALFRENARLEQERVRLAAPPDLSKLWDEAKTLQKENEEWSQRLAEHEVQLLATEADSESRKKDLDKRQGIIDANEHVLFSSLESAKRMEKESKDVLENSRLKAQAILSDAEYREREVAIREIEAKQMKENAERKAKLNQDNEVDLAQREKGLQVRYQTLLRAERYAKEKYGIEGTGSIG